MTSYSYSSDEDENKPLRADASRGIGAGVQDVFQIEDPDLSQQQRAGHGPTWLPAALGRSVSSLRAVAHDRRLVTSALINVCAVVEKVDEQLLPSVYAFVAVSLHATASQLGYLTFSRALVQALASPLGGYLGHYFNRVWVVSGGCLLWAAMTAGFSTCGSVATGAIFWAVNGIGLSMVIPNSQSLTADYWAEGERGRAFGVLQSMTSVGGMLGGLWGTNIGAMQPMGFTGWRVAFAGVGLVSLLIGLLNAAFSKEPRFAEHEKQRLRVPETQHSGFLDGLRELQHIVTLPSFLIIILQGVVGSFPWVALAWCTLYLQLIGMSPLAASACYSAFLGAGSLGSLLGGALGDKAAKWSPRHGRVAVAQVSVGAGVPLMAIVLKVLPANGSTLAVVLYFISFFIMGLTITWCAPACNNPLFAEVVPASKRTLIYAFDRSFEGAIAAMGAPLVGVMAEVYGFGGEASVSGDAAADLAKARPLGDALLMCTCVPWLMCTVFYTGLHASYWRDRQAAALREAGRGAGGAAGAGGAGGGVYVVGGGSGGSGAYVRVGVGDEEEDVGRGVGRGVGGGRQQQGQQQQQQQRVNGSGKGGSGKGRGGGGGGRSPPPSPGRGRGEGGAGGRPAAVEMSAGRAGQHHLQQRSPAVE